MNKDPTIWGTILGSPIFGNPHLVSVCFHLAASPRGRGASAESRDREGDFITFGGHAFLAYCIPEAQQEEHRELKLLGIRC